MTEVTFTRIRDETRLLDPGADFALAVHPLELRQDPLLAHTAVFNPRLAGKAAMLFPPTQRAWLDEWVAQTRATCPFCPERLEATPRFDPTLVPEGRIHLGEAVVMPNLFPLARHHAVAVVCASHFLELAEFTPERVGAALMALHRLAVAVARHDPESRYLVVAANYLFPAGASLTHPHFQLLAGRTVHAQHARLCNALRDWHARHDSSYLDDLVRTEQAGERFLGTLGAWHWLTAFAPLGLDEIQAVHALATRFDELTEADIAALAEGLSRALKLYASLGHLSFNFALFSQPQEEHARLFLRLIARQHPSPAYRNDDYFLQRLLGSELMLIAPEELAQRGRSFFA